jgi:hypothetical protein
MSEVKKLLMLYNFHRLTDAVAPDGFLFVSLFICASEWIGISRITKNDLT